MVVMMVVEWMYWWFVYDVPYPSTEVQITARRAVSQFVILLLWFYSSLIYGAKICMLTAYGDWFCISGIDHAFKSLDHLIGMWLVKKLIITINWSVTGNDFVCVWFHSFELSHSCYLAVVSSIIYLLQSWTQNLFPVQLAVRERSWPTAVCTITYQTLASIRHQYIFWIYSALIFVLLLPLEFLVTSTDLFSLASAPV